MECDKLIVMLKGSHLNTEIYTQIKNGTRFAFGKNWKNFLNVLSEDRIAVAIKSLQDMFQVETLRGATFLDIGCGSGMFSLAAMKLGANVHSFDFDPESVACTTQLKNRYFSGYTSWTI